MLRSGSRCRLTLDPPPYTQPVGDLRGARSRTGRSTRGTLSSGPPSHGHLDTQSPLHVTLDRVEGGLGSEPSCVDHVVSRHLTPWRLLTRSMLLGTER